METKNIEGKWHIECKNPGAKKPRTEIIEEPLDAIIAIARLVELKVKLISVRFEPDGK